MRYSKFLSNTVYNKRHIIVAKQNRTEILFSLPNKHNLTDHCAKCNKETLVKIADYE